MSFDRETVLRETVLGGLREARGVGASGSP